MKLALLGDVHGNADALRAVLCAACEAGVQEILNTGDMVGYYHHPDEVVAQLRAWPGHSVRGNHDDMLAPAAADPAHLALLSAKYGQGLSLALERLTPDARTWIEALPRSRVLDYDGYRILLCHGCPWDTDYYVYPDAPEALLQRITDAAGPQIDLVVLGHTHYQTIWHRNGPKIVNPGSVGQPRDRKPGAAWALLDTQTGRIDLRRQAYDTSPTTHEVRCLDPQLSYLWTVLIRQ